MLLAYGRPQGHERLRVAVAAMLSATLTHYRGAVKELARGDARLSEEQKKELVARMKRVLPDDRLEFLIPLGADAVAAELAAEPRARR